MWTEVREGVPRPRIDGGRFRLRASMIWWASQALVMVEKMAMIANKTSAAIAHAGSVLLELVGIVSGEEAQV